MTTCSSCGWKFDANLVTDAQSDNSLKNTENSNPKLLNPNKSKLHPWNETFPNNGRIPDQENKYAWKMVGKAYVLVDGNDYPDVQTALHNRLSFPKLDAITLSTEKSNQFRDIIK